MKTTIFALLNIYNWQYMSSYHSLRGIKKGLLLLFALLCIQAVPTSARHLDLSGQWLFCAGGDTLPQEWTCHVTLPGSMLTNGLGDEVTVQTPWLMSNKAGNYYNGDEYAPYRTPGNVKVPFTLQPDKYYVGSAWYQREVDIPRTWRKRNIILFLERCHWLTELYVDGEYVGTRNDLCAPQRYDLTRWLSPGRHTLTIKVDNSIRDIDPGANSHSISDNTQGNWNGMAGSLRLEARPRVMLSYLEVHPKLSEGKMTVKIEISNSLDKDVKARIKVGGVTESRLLTSGENQLSMTIPLATGTEYWDEFRPNLYEIEASVTACGITDTRTVRYGCREWSTHDGKLQLNGHPVFLRGNVDCCTFPLTGFPSFDKEYWQRIFQVYKDYGLNHVRFHSWCPPEVAFEVADEMGIYCYVESSSWANVSTSLGEGKGIDGFIYQESEAILREYGNHPSFCLFSYGNEPRGKNHVEFLRQFVNYWKQRDDRFLYTAAAGWPVIEESDWLCVPEPRIQLWGAGLNSIINRHQPSTTYDWSDYTGNCHQPVVSHEIGQWCVYPNFREIEKYTGVYKARNFEIFRDRLEQNGMASLADSFLLASGKLQVLCYKADIEAALRTKDFGGFELLGLNDFSGQGTALTGVVDVFWDDKGYVTGPEYSRFCNDLVPLARMQKLIYTSGETLQAQIEVANYRQAREETQLSWKIRNAAGVLQREGSLKVPGLPLGNCLHCGQIELPLSGLKAPDRYNLEVCIGKEAANDWNFWVYPEVETPGLEVGSQDIVTTDDMDTALEALNQDGKVLLSLGRGRVSKDYGGEVAVGFSSIFWNTLWTGGQPPHTLGLLCNPQHPALKGFPTEYYSDYQWWEVLSQCDAIRYDRLSKSIDPIVRIIDDWFTARPLALVFEIRVGKGKLVVCGADLITDLDSRPAARQLRRSLLDYMKSDAFMPSEQTDPDTLKRIVFQI